MRRDAKTNPFLCFATFVYLAPLRETGCASLGFLDTFLTPFPPGRHTVTMLVANPAPLLPGTQVPSTVFHQPDYPGGQHDRGEEHAQHARDRPMQSEGTN